MFGSGPYDKEDEEADKANAINERLVVLESLEMNALEQRRPVRSGAHAASSADARAGSSHHRFPTDVSTVSAATATVEVEENVAWSQWRTFCSLKRRRRHNTPVDNLFFSDDDGAA